MTTPKTPKIIERLLLAIGVLEEHTQYDDENEEASGEELARLTCVDAVTMIDSLANALRELLSQACDPNTGGFNIGEAIKDADAVLAQLDE
jgi:hypothetical protein